MSKFMSQRKSGGNNAEHADKTIKTGMSSWRKGEGRRRKDGKGR